MRSVSSSLPVLSVQTTGKNNYSHSKASHRGEYLREDMKGNAAKQNIQYIIF